MIPYTSAFIGGMLLTGCAQKPSNTVGAKNPSIGAGSAKGGGGSGGAKAFLDQKKQIPPRKEWNREITSQRGGTIRFQIASQGPFGVTVVTDKGFKALQSGNENAETKQEILLLADSKKPTLERWVTVPAGSSWFIIENQTDKPVEMHLQCFGI
jgi:hypothetical protein